MLKTVEKPNCATLRISWIIENTYKSIDLREAGLVTKIKS